MSHPHTPLTAAEPLLSPLNSRRTALGALGSWGLMALAGCGGGGDSATSTSTSATGTTSGSGTASTGTTTSGSTATSCTVVPEETAGPYPADGSNASNNTYNVLALSGIVRSDIRTNLGSSAAVGGVPLTITLTLTNTQNSCAPLSGYAIYLWHCSREGNYSVYTTNNVNDNYLRGVQETNSSGQVTFTTVVPGCYAGRMPHMHFEVYPNLAAAKTSANKIKTSQLAFPTETLRTVYTNATGYSSSLGNLNSISFATDNVFSDGYALEMVSMSGNLTDGYTAAITVSIAA